MTMIFWIAIFAYILGSIPFTFLAARLIAGKDLSRHGSGNLGGTNAVRVLGWVPGIAAGLCDVGKASLAVLAAHRWGGGNPWCVALAMVAVSAGHNWSVFFLFRKGGKGVATTIGGALALQPVAVLIAIGFALEVVILSRLVSLGALLLVTLIPVGFILSHAPTPMIIASIVLCGTAFYRHRENIRRLWNGEERRLGVKD